MKIREIDIPATSVLAPMAGVSDLAFRKLVREMGCGLCYTEFVSADGIVRSQGERAQMNGSMRLLRTAPEDHLLGVQLFGSDPAIIAEAARIAYEQTRCDILDINMGCWVPKVIKRGAGAALLKDPSRVEAIVRAVVGAVPIPVTAKIRAGFAADSINHLETGRAIEAGGASAVTLHARTRAERHTGTPRWELIAQLKNAVKIPVMGNGGVITAKDAVAMRAQTGCDAVMIGRAALSQPWIFSQVADLDAGREAKTPNGAERMTMVKKHIEYAVELNRDWQTRTSRKKGLGYDQHAILKLRGMFATYTTGIPGATEFRRSLSTMNSVERALEALEKVFARADEWQPPRAFTDDSEEASCAA